MASSRRITASVRSLVALYTIGLAAIMACCSGDQSLLAAAVVQPFDASSQAGGFVNDAATSSTASGTSGSSMAMAVDRESDFENTAMSAGDALEIVGNLQPGSYSGVSIAAVGESDATELSVATTNEDAAQDGEDDGGDGSQAAVLSAGTVAGVLCVGAALFAHRRRRQRALHSPGTPPEKSTYYHVQRQLTPPPV